MADKEVTVKIITETDVSQVEDLQDKIDDIKTSAESAGDSLQEAFQEATNEVERLEDALAEAELNGDDIEADILADELADARDRAEELEEAINRVGSVSVSDVAEDIGGISDSANNADDAINQLNDSMGILESGALLAVADQLGQIGSGAEGMAQDMNTAAITVGQLSTNVGVSESAMVGLINNISNVTFPQQEAMAYVQALNQMGVSADQLGTSATNMDKINDATGIGYQSVMQLTQGLQAVGVQANNLPSSFNAIAYAQANVNGGANTLGLVLKRQAATINEYGLNVDQLVVMMQALSARGVQGMKMGSELSSVLKENNGDIQAVEKSLGLQAGALSNASQMTGQYEGQLQQLANEEMEHKTWLDQLGAAYEDITLSMSSVLSPAMSVIGIIGQFGQFTVGINGILSLAETFGILETANLSLIPTQIAEGAAGWFSIGWIALAIALGLALGAGLIYLYNNSETFRGAVDALANSIMWMVDTAYQGFLSLVADVSSALQQIAAYIGISGDDIIGSVLNVMYFMATLPMQLGVILTNLIANVLGFKGNFVSNITSTATSAVRGFISPITGMASSLANELNQMLSAVSKWAATLPGKFWDAGVNAVKQFLSALGIASPGTMQRMLIWEISEMGNRVPEESQTLLRNVSTLGSEVVDSFGEPSLDVNQSLNTQLSNIPNTTTQTNGGWRDFIVNVYGDIDNDRRVQQIVDVIKRELSFENTTAGRTV